MTKVAFFGYRGVFGHYGIGGTESIVRRLAYGLTDQGFQVDFVRFGLPNDGVSKGEKNVPVCDFVKFENAMRFLEGKYDHVITIYIPAGKRVAYGLFRKQNKKIRFHFLFQVWAASRVKRQAKMAELSVFPYNGHVFCVSPRLFQLVSRYFGRTVLLLPPVPNNYFLKPNEKSIADSLRITYIGRLDPGKGADIALRFFKHLVNRYSDIQAQIYGYTWQGYTDTEKLHLELLKQRKIAYFPSERYAYSPEIDSSMHQIFSDTDVLFLPYVALSSTVDTPLVMLEGMAHLAAVITSFQGDLPQLYGNTKLFFESYHDLEKIEQAVLELRDSLVEERQRIFQHTKKLGIQTSQVVNRLAEHLQ